jgi:hypothetical protein
MSDITIKISDTQNGFEVFYNNEKAKSLLGKDAEIIHSLNFESRYFVQFQNEMREKGMTISYFDRPWWEDEIDFDESMKSKNLYAAPVGISIDKIG